MRWVLAASILLFGCHKESKTEQLAFPDSIAPPLGLDGLHDEQVEAATKLLPQAERQKDTLSLRRPGYEVSIGIEDERTGDIELAFRSCDQLRPSLEAKWGRGEQRGGEVLWSSDASKWVAGLRTTVNGCVLSFTSALYFDAIGTPVGAVRGTTLGARPPPRLTNLPDGSAPSTALFGATSGVTTDSAGMTESMDATLPPRAVAALQRAWGAGEVVKANPRTVGWRNTTTNRMAILLVRADEPSTLRITSSLPLEQWLGDGTEVAAFPRDLWKLTIEQLGRMYPSLHVDLELPYTAEAPATDTSWNRISLTLAVNAQRLITDVQFSVPANERSTSLLVKKWGLTVHPDGSYSSADGRVTATPQQATSSLVVVVGRP